MRLEQGYSNKGPALVLIAETEEESELIDEMLSNAVQDGTGFIANVEGEVRLEDGYGHHYIYLRKAAGDGCH